MERSDGPGQDFRAAAHWFAELVRLIPGDAWAAPGLGEWDLRALVGHASRSLVTVDTYLDRPVDQIALDSPEAYYHCVAELARHPGVAERGRVAGAALGGDPVAAIAGLVERVLARIPDADPVIETLAGGMRLSNYLPTRTFELVVHGLDIVAATSITPPELSPELLSAAVTLAGRVAVLTGRGPTLLAALTGRSRLPIDFSVV